MARSRKKIRCWTRRAKSRRSYVVCTGSRGQKTRRGKYRRSKRTGRLVRRRLGQKDDK